MENNYKFKAVVKKITELEHFIRTTKPDIFKRRLILELDEDSQIMAEIRNNFIAKLSTEGIEEGSKVIVELSFDLAENGIKYYNNILIKDIKLDLDEK